MPYKDIYILCPYGLVTGGPDALHQLAYYLKELRQNAHIIYNDINRRNKAIPNAYQKYINDYLLLKDIVDDDKNAIIVPETLTHYLDKYTNIHKYVWWLSVDNNYSLTESKHKIRKILKKVFSLDNFKKLYKIRTLKDFIKNKKYEFKDDNVIHLCASHYAYKHVCDRAINKDNVKLLIEPISKYFLEHPYEEKEKEDIVLYNPKKNGEYLKKIIKLLPSTKFVKLEGFNQSQLIDVYSKAKLYVDFGSFPGAERMPKEAVRYGCAIITGKRGAASFYKDVVIDDEFKFDETEENIPLIVNKIQEVMANYSSLFPKFDAYRETVNNLEKNFIDRLKEEFC